MRTSNNTNRENNKPEIPNEPNSYTIMTDIKNVELKAAKARMEKKNKKEKSKARDILEWVYCIIIALIIAFLIKYYVGTPTIVKQVSMKYTLIENDRLLLNRWSRTTKKLPKRGAIITFEAPTKNDYTKEDINLFSPIAKYENEPQGILDKFSYYVIEYNKKSYIKRVIALPGEYVEIKDGRVYIDGKLLKEDYLDFDGDGVYDVDTEATGLFNRFVVPENCVFAMGDNRPESMDCRVFGCVPLNKIEGIVVLRFWPLNKFGKVD